MSEDEDATLMMPSPRTSASDDEPEERCLTPAVGVSSMGDTYFETTQTGNMGRAEPVEVIDQNSLAEPVASNVTVGEARQELFVTPPATTAPLGRRAQRLPPHLEKVMENRKVLWPLALLGGAIVGLIIALALRGMQQDAVPGDGPPPATDSALAMGPAQAPSPATERAKAPKESPLPPSEAKTEDALAPPQVTATNLLEEEEVHALQKAALLAELGGDCQESARIYHELERGDQPSARERWQVFSRAVRLRCAHVTTEAKRTGDIQ
jgi:hypothetical protein